MIIPQNEEIKMPEIWKPVNFWNPNVRPYYLVSNYGLVYNGSTYNTLPQNIDYCKDKYINIRLTLNDGSYIQEMMQRIVMYVFAYIDGCEKLEVNHKDGIKYHNWIWNLEWSTHKENIDHAWNNKLFKFGQERKNTKLTENQVREICLMLQNGCKPEYIIKIYNIEGVNMRNAVYNIATKHCWSYISNEYDISRGIGRGKSSTTNFNNEIIKPIEFD